MKTLRLISLSSALVASAFATPTSPALNPSTEVIELAPYVIEATRTPSAAELAQSSLAELKDAATAAPARVPVATPLTQSAPARNRELAAQLTRATSVAFAKPTAPAASSRY